MPPADSATAPTLLVALTATLSCCAPPASPSPPIERTRTVAAAPEEVRARLDEELRSLGFTAGAEGSWARTTGLPVSWADCRTIVIGGGETGGQRSHARPLSRAAEVRPTLIPSAGGTQLTIATSFEATYHHRFRNLPFTAACASTGELERALLAAAG
jgi:hypothetical protein